MPEGRWRGDSFPCLTSQSVIALSNDEGDALKSRWAVCFPVDSGEQALRAGGRW